MSFGPEQGETIDIHGMESLELFEFGDKRPQNICSIGKLPEIPSLQALSDFDGFGGGGMEPEGPNKFRLWTVRILCSWSLIIAYPSLYLSIFFADIAIDLFDKNQEWKSLTISILAQIPRGISVFLAKVGEVIFGAYDELAGFD